MHDKTTRTTCVDNSHVSTAKPNPDAGNATTAARPFLMVTFNCRGASAYQRVYRSQDGTHYLARCPRCGQSQRFVVGPGGTGSRAFVVECG